VSAALDVLDAVEAPATLELALTVLGDLAGPGPSTLDATAVVTTLDRLFAGGEVLDRLLRAGRMPPSELWPARGVAAALGTIARLGVRADWPRLVRDALARGWEAAGG
jgi:hypothetical protein